MLTSGKILVEGLLEGYEAALIQTGYSITTKLLLIRRAELLIRRHLNMDRAYFDQGVIDHYTREIDDKYFKGNMQEKHYERSKRGIDRFVNYVRTGKLSGLLHHCRASGKHPFPQFASCA